MMKYRPYKAGRDPGFLGQAHAPFTPSDERVKQDMVLKDVSLDRLQGRNALLHNFDRFQRDGDDRSAMDGLDANNQNEFGILTSSRLAEAFDLEKEDLKLPDRYGRGTETTGPVSFSLPPGEGGAPLCYGRLHLLGLARQHFWSWP